MSVIELLPCPFCGGKAELRTMQVSEDEESAYVKCLGCEATTDIFEDAYAPTADAITAWNKRPASEAASTIEALQARVKVLEQDEKDAIESIEVYKEHITALQARVRELEGERDKAYNDGLEAAAVWHESQTRFGLSQYELSAKEIRGLKRENFHHNSAENIRALGASS